MTLTYVYADQTAVLGPLALAAEPHAYDLCEEHAQRLSAPRGWDVVRLSSDAGSRTPSDDDMLALADAVREAAARPQPALSPELEQVSLDATGVRETGRRGHLRVLASSADDVDGADRG